MSTILQGAKKNCIIFLPTPWELENVIDYPEYTHMIHTFRQLLAWSISTEDMPPVSLPKCKLNL